MFVVRPRLMAPRSSMLTNDPCMSWAGVVFDDDSAILDRCTPQEVEKQIALSWRRFESIWDQPPASPLEEISQPISFADDMPSPSPGTPPSAGFMADAFRWVETVLPAVNLHTVAVSCLALVAGVVVLGAALFRPSNTSPQPNAAPPPPVAAFAAAGGQKLVGDLTSQDVYGTGGPMIGRITDVVVVLDVGEYAGIRDKRVAANLREFRIDHDRLMLERTKEQLQQAPAYPPAYSTADGNKAGALNNCDGANPTSASSSAPGG